MIGRSATLGVVVVGLLACSEAPVLPPGVVDAGGLVSDAGSNAGVDAAPATDDVAPTDVSGAAEVGTTDLGLRCVDMDRDGYPTTECGGMAPDCDDANPNVNPGRTEVCDRLDLDEDCDPCTVAGATDGDGDGDTFISSRCVNSYRGATPVCPGSVRVEAALIRGRDCDDTNSDVRPNQSESCNEIDDNCNGMINEGVQRTFYRDADRDGYGDRRPTTMVQMGCSPPMGYVEDNSDCDDDPTLGSSVNPGAREVCDGARRDENCNGRANGDEVSCPCVLDETQPCCSGRGIQTCVTATAPASGTMWSACSVRPASVETPCNGIDEDCDGLTDDRVCSISGQSCVGSACSCGSGRALCGGTCQPTGACTMTDVCASPGTWSCSSTGVNSCVGTARPTCPTTPSTWSATPSRTCRWSWPVPGPGLYGASYQYNEANGVYYSSAPIGSSMRTATGRNVVTVAIEQSGVGCCAGATPSPTAFVNCDGAGQEPIPLTPAQFVSRLTLRLLCSPGGRVWIYKMNAGTCASGACQRSVAISAVEGERTVPYCTQ